MIDPAPRPALDSGPISRFPVPPREELPGDLQDRFDEVEKRSGFLPNVFAALGWRPDEARAFFAMHDALMDKREGLTLAEREMIVVAISAANQCQYCVVAHGAILRIRAKDPTISELVSANWRKADNVTPKQKAMLGFALKVAQEAHLVSEADRQALRDAGLALDWLREHPRVTWRMFRGLVRDADGLFTWPDRLWLPLAYSLSARKRDEPSAAG